MTELLSPRQLKTWQEFSPQDIFSLSTINLEFLKNEISGIENQFAQDHLSTLEQERFFSFKYPKRQVEWLGGRLAAKRSVARLLAKKGAVAPIFPEISVDSTLEGRPVLHVNQVPSPIDISISHSGNRAAALAVRSGLCGIDIQEITKTITKVKSRFASKAEEQIIQQVPCLKTKTQEAGLALIWSAKEAFRKGVVCQPVLGFLEVSLEEVSGTIEEGLIGIFTCTRPGAARQMKAFFTLSNTFAVAMTYQKAEEI